MSMLHVHVNIHVHIYRNSGMPDRPASGQSGTGLKKITMPEQAWYRTRLTQFRIFLVRYQTKIRHAGMLMPALVSSKPMPSYAYEAMRITPNCGKLLFVNGSIDVPLHASDWVL
jgi:hypothetical protein